MIYTTADRLMHIASAMETINREWSAQLKGMANYIRGLESTNINLYSELREAKKALDEAGNQIPDAEAEAYADRIRAQLEDAVALETSNLDAIAIMDLPACGETLSDLIESLHHIEQP